MSIYQPTEHGAECGRADAADYIMSMHEGHAPEPLDPTSAYQALSLQDSALDSFAICCDLGQLAFTDANRDAFAASYVSAFVEAAALPFGPLAKCACSVCASAVPDLFSRHCETCDSCGCGLVATEPRCGQGWPA